MEIVRASATWGGPESNVYTLYVEPTPELWEADRLGDSLVFIYRVLDEDEQETDDVAGVEIIGFLEFEEWDILPRLPLLWQFPGWEPLPLEKLLKKAQHELRVESSALAHRTS